jgi:hypothetical protein
MSISGRLPLLLGLSLGFLLANGAQSAVTKKSSQNG